MSNQRSSPALRSLQITTDGKTLIGRSPIDGKSPSMKKERLKENPRSARKITAFFPNGHGKEQNGTSNGNDKVLEEQNGTSMAKQVERKIATKQCVDTGMNTDLELPPSITDEEQIREKLYSSGPKIYDPKTGQWNPYWETCAKEMRQKMKDALAEKMACDAEIAALLEEKRQLEEELEEYKPYFELRDRLNAALGEGESGGT